MLLQALNFAAVIASGLMIWKGLGLICNTESPIVVVLRCVLLFVCVTQGMPTVYCSGSMEPAFYRGDLLFLTNPASEQYLTGDITVYKIPGADIPIVHRVIETHDVLSKGCVSSTQSFNNCCYNECIFQLCSCLSVRSKPTTPHEGR